MMKKETWKMSYPMKAQCINLSPFQSTAHHGSKLRNKQIWPKKRPNKSKNCSKKRKKRRQKN